MRQPPPAAVLPAPPVVRFRRASETRAGGPATAPLQAWRATHSAMPTTRAGPVLLSAEQIQQRVREMAAEIERDYPPGEPLHLVAVLKGGFVFLADLVRAMQPRVTLDFMAVSSYKTSTSTSGEVQLLKDLEYSIQGRAVIIVEDIVDTGLTLRYLQEVLRARAPASLRTACLLSKPSRRLVDVKLDYIGFTIEDRFVVGYGLDFAQEYRNLPYIAILEQVGDAT